MSSSVVEGVLCRTVGCTSIFARWWQWPHRLICTPLATRGLR